MFKTVYVSNFKDFYEENKEHFEKHYNACEEERASHRGLNIDINLFQQLIDLGTVNFFKLYEDEELVGYINVSVAPSPLFSKVEATIDFLYILPDHRKKNYASKAISEIEQELVNSGISELNMCLPTKEYSSNVAESLGYTKVSSNYLKQIGD